jgi:type IV pilus assembly protein PilM
MGLFGPTDITGVDVGAGSIKVVRVRRGRRPRLLSAAIVETPLEPGKGYGTADDLRFLLSDKDTGKRRAVTLLPSRLLTVRSFLLPRMPEKELSEAVRWESKRHISYALDAAQVEFVIVGERREGATDKLEVLMVAAERNTVLEHLAPFREAGLDVVAVDANPLALRNVFRLRVKPDGGNTLIVDIGAGKTEINIFKGAGLRFSRCVETGGLDMTRALAEELKVSLDEAEAAKRRVDLLAPAGEDRVAALVRRRLDILLLEVRRSIEYYKTTFRETGLDRTVLTGGVTLLTGIKDYVSPSLEGPVEVDAPFAALECPPELLQEFGPQGPRFSTAVGLALRQA